MGTIVRGERRPFGPIINDTNGMATTTGQVGGEGVCRWKMLMNGMHLEGEWNCVEYVVIEPGGSVGEHVHMRTEEIYYIIFGEAVMTMDGDEFVCVAGDLITTPIGSSHSIENRSQEDMHFFVVEVFPREGTAARPARIHVPQLDKNGASGNSRDLDLRPYFTGAWSRFRLLELAAGASDESLSASSTEVLHVLDGSAVINVDGQRYTGVAGLSVAVPPRFSRRIENVEYNPLTVIITEVTIA
jgi:mannose-6-phosphate isomerase-like protein (cupin superfamily)